MNPTAITMFMNVLRRHLPDWLMEWVEIFVGAGLFAKVMNIHFGKEVFSPEDQDQLAVILGDAGVPENGVVYGWMLRLGPYPTQHFIHSMLDLARPSGQGKVDQNSVGYHQARMRIRQIAQATPDRTEAGDEARTNEAVRLGLINHPATYLGARIKTAIHAQFVSGGSPSGPNMFRKLYDKVRGSWATSPPTQPPVNTPANLQPQQSLGWSIFTKIWVVLAIIAVVVIGMILLTVRLTYSMVYTAIAGDITATIWLAVVVNILLAIFKRSAKLEDAKYVEATITGIQVATLVCVAASFMFNIGGKL